MRLRGRRGASGPSPRAARRALGAPSLLLLWVAGCAVPPPSPPPADVAFPPPGTTWVTRVADGRGVVTAVTWTVLDDGTHDGTPVHRVASGTEVRLYDATTRNWMATLQHGRARWAASPHDGTFAWPLRVGKAWVSSVALHDHARGVGSSPVVTFWEVEAYEEVEVPAGKFKAFKLHGSPGLNNVTFTTLWYAPEIALVVRQVREGTAGVGPGPAAFVTELVEYHAP